MNDFGDLLGTPYAPVSKIAPVKYKVVISHICMSEIKYIRSEINSSNFCPLPILIGLVYL